MFPHWLRLWLRTVDLCCWAHAKWAFICQQAVSGQDAVGPAPPLLIYRSLFIWCASFTEHRFASEEHGRELSCVRNTMFSIRSQDYFFLSSSHLMLIVILVAIARIILYTVKSTLVIVKLGNNGACCIWLKSTFFVNDRAQLDTGPHTVDMRGPSS